MNHVTKAHYKYMIYCLKMSHNPTEAINNATSSSIKEYHGTSSSTSMSGNFPKFVSEHYHKNRASTHGDTMRNVARQYKNTTFYK